MFKLPKKYTHFQTINGFQKDNKLFSASYAAGKESLQFHKINHSTFLQ